MLASSIFTNALEAHAGPAAAPEILVQGDEVKSNSFQLTLIPSLKRPPL
jgi:acyl carrier protein